MSHNNHWRSGAACEADEFTSGFEETLPPSDPRVSSGMPGSGYAVRGNLSGLQMSDPKNSERALPSAFGETPVSGIVRRRHGAPIQVPVARITRDEVDVMPSAQPAALPRDTQQDAKRPFSELEMDVTPDFASEYVPPQPLPESAQHKTFELSPVQLHPAVHPRTAPTVLNVRTQQRRDEKRRKDAHDIALFTAQSHRRRRGPWIVVAFLSVVSLGFIVGAKLVDSSEAGAETEHGLAEGTKVDGALLASPTKPELASKASKVTSPKVVHSLNAARPKSASSEPAPAARSEVAPSSVAAKTGDTTVSAREPARPAKAKQSLAVSPPKPAAKSNRQAAPAQSDAAKPGREVWLK